MAGAGVLLLPLRRLGGDRVALQGHTDKLLEATKDTLWHGGEALAIVEQGRSMVRRCTKKTPLELAI